MALASGPLTFVLVLVRVIFILFVEVWEGIADVLDFNLWRDGAKGERVDLDGADEARKRHLLEPLVDEGADGLGAGFSISTARERVPVDINRHCYSTRA